VAKYEGVAKEETLKGLVRDDYFSGFGYEPNIGNIDFIITGKNSRGELFSEETAATAHYLWAEAKKGVHDVFDMFTQLALTCRKTYQKADYLAPPWLGCFDEARIAFAPFHGILPLFTETDVNWNTPPSNHETPDFQKARAKVKNLIASKIIVFHFGQDDREIHDFIKTRFTAGETGSIQSPITKDNFVQIFIKWVKEVKPSINIPKDEWAEFKQKGILDCDFFRADMMSSGGNMITEKLKIVLKNDNYKFQEHIAGRLFTSDIGFTDNGAAYSRFWNKYKRPPAAEYRQYIVDRRDLLVPQNIREVKGSFFTPKVWADKSKEYLSHVFGDAWQDEYYVWDCAAGTGNLLAGLSNEYNVWASDVEQGNVETIQSLIDIDDNLNLLSAHVFQFDFLNDSVDKLPEGLREIINDPEKCKKLIIYINPPYAESSGGPGAKKGVTTSHAAHFEYKNFLGKAGNELFAHFMIRVYAQMQGAHLAVFSTLKYLNSSNFTKFRKYFCGVFKKGFICKANTFDNVNGEFPIGFLVWELTGYAFKNQFPKEICLDVLNTKGCFLPQKSFYNEKIYINKWIIPFSADKNSIGNLYFTSNDFQQNNLVYISLRETSSHLSSIGIDASNIAVACIYFSVRHCIKHTWINHNDQFLYPNNKWSYDLDFQKDCLIYALLADKNRVSAADGVNHWIPFTEKEVNAKEKFQSNFMSGFLKTIHGLHGLHGLSPVDTNPIRENPCSSVDSFSAEAQAVLDAGRELWKYYHDKIKTNRTAPVNASFYDIREFFQGRKESGTMNPKSVDETYNALIKTLREALKVLAKKIEPKVYEYGFLKE
jgi:hypothetical protein